MTLHLPCGLPFMPLQGDDEEFVEAAEEPPSTQLAADGPTEEAAAEPEPEPAPEPLTAPEPLAAPEPEPEPAGPASGPTPAAAAPASGGATAKPQLGKRKPGLVGAAWQQSGGLNLPSCMACLSRCVLPAVGISRLRSSDVLNFSTHAPALSPSLCSL